MTPEKTNTVDPADDVEGHRRRSVSLSADSQSRRCRRSLPSATRRYGSATSSPQRGQTAKRTTSSGSLQVRGLDRPDGHDGLGRRVPDEVDDLVLLRLGDLRRPARPPPRFCMNGVALICGWRVGR